MVEILKYTDPAGHTPFDRWHLKLSDPAAQAADIVLAREHLARHRKETKR